MVQTVIRHAVSAQEIAVDLIDDHHEHLQRAKILWLFTNSKRTRGNKITLGTASRTAALAKFLASGQVSVEKGPDFIVLIDGGKWDTALKTQREAMVDHLLCRMRLREKHNERTGKITRTWITVAPDVEEFTDVILRHGIWLPEQKRFVKLILEGRQMKLDLDLPDLAGSEESDEEDESAKPAAKVSLDGVEHPSTCELIKNPSGATCTCGALAAASRISDAIVGDSVIANDSLVTPSEPNGTGDPAETPSPTWQATAGVGSSEIEKHRRSRRAPATAGAPT